MIEWTQAFVNGKLEEGRIPFVECPGDDLCPAAVSSFRGQWDAICGQCGGTCRLADVRWLTPGEAIRVGWAVMLEPAPGAPQLLQ